MAQTEFRNALLNTFCEKPHFTNPTRLLQTPTASPHHTTRSMEAPTPTVDIPIELLGLQELLEWDATSSAAYPTVAEQEKEVPWFTLDDLMQFQAVLNTTVASPAWTAPQPAVHSTVCCQIQTNVANNSLWSQRHIVETLSAHIDEVSRCLDAALPTGSRLAVPQQYTKKMRREGSGSSAASPYLSPIHSPRPSASSTCSSLHVHQSTDSCSVSSDCMPEIRRSQSLGRRKTPTVRTLVFCDACNARTMSKYCPKTARWFRHNELGLPTDRERPCDICGGVLDAPVPTTRLVGFTCKICDQHFKRGDRLVAHSARHTNVKAFNCPSCPRTFSRHTRLLEHAERFHPSVTTAHSRSTPDHAGVPSHPLVFHRSSSV